MKKQIAIVMLLAMVASLFVATAAAQMTGTVKGKATDDKGQPIVGATVTFESMDTGRKMPPLKTDKKGEYFSMGFSGGKYKVSLLDGATNQVIWYYNNINIGIAKDNVVDFDLAKERKAAAAAQASTMTEEQKKAQEAAVKENTKIKGLNAMLTQASDLRKAGNCDEAVNIMTQAVAQDTTHDVIYSSLAESQMCAKKYTEAIDSYKKAIALANKGEYHNNLGQAYLKSNQMDEAIKEYDTAAQIDPPNAAMYYFNEGAVLTNHGKVDEAAAAFDKAIKADPTKADAYYQKGVSLLGKAKTTPDGKMIAPEGTAEAFNKYLELQPTGPYAEGAKQMLALIGAKVETTFGKTKSKK